MPEFSPSESRCTNGIMSTSTGKPNKEIVQANDSFLNFTCVGASSCILKPFDNITMQNMHNYVNNTDN